MLKNIDDEIGKVVATELIGYSFYENEQLEGSELSSKECVQVIFKQIREKTFVRVIVEFTVEAKPKFIAFHIF